MPKSAKTETVHLRVRVRRTLLRQLEEAAKREKVPLTTVVVKRLEASFEADRVEKVVGRVEDGLAQIREEMEMMREMMRLKPRLPLPHEEDK